MTFLYDKISLGKIFHVRWVFMALCSLQTSVGRISDTYTVYPGVKLWEVAAHVTVMLMIVPFLSLSGPNWAVKENNGLCWDIATGTGTEPYQGASDGYRHGVGGGGGKGRTIAQVCAGVAGSVEGWRKGGKKEWQDVQRLSSQLTRKNKIIPFVVKRSSKVTWVNHNVTWWAEEEEEEKEEEETITDNSRQQVKRSQVLFSEKWFLHLSWNKSKWNPTWTPWITIALETRAAARCLCASASSGLETGCFQNQATFKDALPHSAPLRHYVYRSCGRDVGTSAPLKKYKYLMASKWQITSSGN